jgi:4-alpha-glucanotransferase
VRSGGASASVVVELAELHGVQTSFEGIDGRAHRADQDVLLATLRALGSPVRSADDAAAALSEKRRLESRVRLQPILVHRIGRAASTALRLPSGVHPRDVWWTIEFEDGGMAHHRLTSGLTAMAAGAGSLGQRDNTYLFHLEPNRAEPIPPGYHRVIVEWPGSELTALLIAAPRCPLARRGWGVFLPLHALRTEDDWGVGSYPDLAELGSWVGGLGGAMVGALPLYPAFLDPPADPSPYLPVSRLAYNEIFVDPTSLPELAEAPEARRLLAGNEFQRRLAWVHQAELVDYEEVSRLRRQVLTPMADALLQGTSVRREEFCAFVQQHPELLAYAQFRANRETHEPETGEARSTPARPTVVPTTLGYHLYAQWVAAQQLSAAALSTPLYADLPVGVHPDGFDPHWSPHTFVLDVHGGAPPDRFFEGGQDWSFPPLHPERVREDGYRYFIDTLRRAFRHASYLRVDHVMGLERLYWIPQGFDAQHGAYVSYRTDELHALVSLEAHRAGTVVVGEDLGTVPASLRSRMAEDRMLRSWVLQFESTPERPLPMPPARALASWGTHDLARFTSYFWGTDIDENESLGHLSVAEAVAQRSQRVQWRTALLHAIGATEGVGDPAATALRSCLFHLARSAVDLVMVDLEELWGEREPQNRPGTGAGGANWSHRASRTLEEARDDPATAEFLRQLSGFRNSDGYAARARADVVR